MFTLEIMIISTERQGQHCRASGWMCWIDVWIFQVLTRYVGIHSPYAYIYYYLAQVCQEPFSSKEFVWIIYFSNLKTKKLDKSSTKYYMVIFMPKFVQKWSVYPSGQLGSLCFYPICWATINVSELLLSDFCQSATCHDFYKWQLKAICELKLLNDVVYLLWVTYMNV